MDNVIRHPAPQQADDHATVERLPPADVAAEQSLLGAMLLDPRVVEDVIETVDAEDFYRIAHGTIFRTIASAYAVGQILDPITLAERLRKEGQLDRVGGASYFNILISAAQVTSLAPDHARIVHEAAQRRRILVEIEQAAHRIRTGDGDLADTAAAARDALDGATRTTAGARHLEAAFLNWPEFFATDFGDVELLPGRLMAPGQQIALVGDGKAGKSLFSLEWAWRMATGQSFLGDKPQDPITVLYADAENGHEQIQERLISFGATPHGMGRLKYASFPRIRPLDTPGGGQDLLALTKRADAQLVFLDTISRFIAGPENDADTWLNVYRHTLMLLKRDGIGSVRLDHFGKDKDRGGRGSSAKTQDVDHVWELSAQGGGILGLKRTHTRTGIGPDAFPIRRESRRHGDHWVPGATRHTLVTFEYEQRQDTPGTVEYVIGRLDAAGLPNDAGNPAARKTLAELQVPARKALIEEAVRLRKARTQTGTGNDTPDTHSGTVPMFMDEPGHEQPRNVRNDLPPDVPRDLDPAGSPGESPAIFTGSTKPQVKHSPGTPGEPPGNAPSPPSPPSKEGEGVGKREPTDPTNDGDDPPSCTLCGYPITNPDRVNRGYDTHVMCPQPANAQTTNAPEED
ncbi:DnaB-like helicase N-terminal domain-containing protein [Streptomyces sp. MI02-7b]|uniref:DnaB-like helicase N-terminal domain-containing protein n=1 Tax=Streptomyces sp. MI02-7b TaxID=462941 RepID=UPI0029BDF4CE|nr:DnaB-like helicase N-terminal domain-containing protein [Streptomyces sp. MI02-7b]MDX3074595.1 DnaB-like helicase N-terminal domain-containing protein [Streptomyces sp. MI02-7b]